LLGRNGWVRRLLGCLEVLGSLRLLWYLRSLGRIAGRCRGVRVGRYV